MKSKVKIDKHNVVYRGLSLLGSSPTYAQESDSALSRLEGRTSKLEVLKGLKVSGYFQGSFSTDRKSFVESRLSEYG